VFLIADMNVMFIVVVQVLWWGGCFESGLTKRNMHEAHTLSVLLISP
jgi:hypothetical protein